MVTTNGFVAYCFLALSLPSIYLANRLISPTISVDKYKRTSRVARLRYLTLILERLKCLYLDYILVKDANKFE